MPSQKVTPSGPAAPGLANACITAFGSSGASHGALSATSDQKMMMAAPIMPIQLSRNSAKDLSARTSAPPYSAPVMVVCSAIRRSGCAG